MHALQEGQQRERTRVAQEEGDGGMSNLAEARDAAHAAKLAALIEDLEFLLSCSVGEAHILHSTGYAGREASLRRRLERCGRRDLIQRIFEWDTAVNEQQHPNPISRRKKAA
jgi:hypothetical protein